MSSDARGLPESPDLEAGGTDVPPAGSEAPEGPSAAVVRNYLMMCDLITSAHPDSSYSLEWADGMWELQISGPSSKHRLFTSDEKLDCYLQGAYDAMGRIDRNRWSRYADPAWAIPSTRRRP